MHLSTLCIFLITIVKCYTEFTEASSYEIYFSVFTQSIFLHMLLQIYFADMHMGLNSKKHNFCSETVSEWRKLLKIAYLTPYELSDTNKRKLIIESSMKRLVHVLGQSAAHLSSQGLADDGSSGGV